MARQADLPPDVVEIISRVLGHGGSLTPSDKRRMQQELSVLVPSDPNYQVVAQLAHGPQLPAATPTPTPAEPSNPPSSGPGTPTLDFLAPLAGVISTPQNTGPAQVYGANSSSGGNPLDLFVKLGLAGQPPDKTQGFDFPPQQTVGAAGNGDPNSPAAVAAAIASGKYAGGSSATPDLGPIADRWKQLVAQGAIPSDQSSDLGAAGDANQSPNDAAIAAASAGSGMGGMHGPGDYLVPSAYKDYSFYNLTPYARQQLLSDQAGPAIEALNLANQQGGGRSAAYFMEPYVQAAMKLSAIGALGGPNTDPNIFGGPASSEAQLKQVEDLINGQSQSGNMVDPTALMAAVLTQAAGTPNDATGFQAGNPSADLQNPDDEIQLTNEAMQAAGQWLAPSAQKGLQNALNAATLNYKDMLSHGTTTMSYPDYLRSLGIVQMFGGS